MVNNIILNLLRADASIVVNKALAKQIGLNEAIVYSELISKYYYFSNKGNLTEEGFFFCTVDDLQDSTTFSKHQQSKAINKLVKLGLIKYKVAGLPARRYFKITEDLNRLINLLNNKEKARQTIEIDKKLKNLTTVSEKSEQLQVKKVNSNNTKSNNTKFNNQSVSHDIEIDSNIELEQKENEGLTDSTQNEFEGYKKIIEKSQLDDVASTESNKQALEQSLRLLYFNKKGLKLGSSYIPYQLIREDLKKVNQFILEHALNKFEKASREKEIKNTIAYLSSCVYDSIHSNGIDIDSELRYAGII